ncbi:hypothetical protein FOA52_008988 [Chlamydomonas sp. UWO 241]|nr:hypothetical protein FOA52_008988 [Chlamydomonas sp. UWO 241]
MASHDQPHDEAGEVAYDLNDDDDHPSDDDEDLDEAGADEGEEGEGEDGAGGSGAAPMEDDEDDSIHVFEGHTDCVLSVAWSPAHADLVACGGQDEVAFVWRAGQDAYSDSAGTMGTAELRGHTDSVVSLKFNAAGSLLATGGMEGCVKVWDVKSGDLVSTLDGPGGSVDWVTWHPKGDVVLAGSEDFTMWMWSAQTGTCMQVFSGHSGAVTAGMFTPDGKHVVSVGGEDDCSLRAWNPKTGDCTTTVSGHGFHETGIVALDVHSDCLTVITGADDGTLKISNIGNGRVVGALIAEDQDESSVESVGFCKQLPLAASAGIDGNVRVWDMASLSQRGVCKHPDVVTRMVWHPTQPLVFTGCVDGVVRCWDIRTAAPVRVWRGHTAAIQDLAVSPDGGMVLTGSDDNTARVFVL